MNTIVVLLELLSGVLFIADIALYFFWKQRRNIFSWCRLILIAMSAAFLIILNGFVSSSLKEDIRENSGYYLAYKYMTENQFEDAENVLYEAGTDTSAGQYFKGLFYLEQGNDTYADFMFERAKSYEDVSAGELDAIHNAQKVCEEQTKKKIGGLSDKEIISLAKNYVEGKGLSSAKKKEYEKAYQLDRTYKDVDLSEISEEEIEKLEESYGENEKVYQLKTKYYQEHYDFAQAKQQAKKLIDAYNTEENQIIYTDVLLQEVYSGSYMSDEEDEDYNYDDESDYVHENGDYDYIEEKEDGIVVSEEQKETLSRVSNYISYLQEQGDNSTGMYDLQLAKIDLLKGDENSASEHLNNIIRREINVNENSRIKREVEDVIAIYNSMTAEEMAKGQITNAVRSLVSAQSGGMLPENDSTVNGLFENYVSKTLKYDKVLVFISKIDTTKYPQITAKINVNGTKEDGETELASEFEASDFSVLDTGDKISDFELIKTGQNDSISYGLVMDRSGSMEDGNAIGIAQNAASQLVDALQEENQEMALVSYSGEAQLDVPLTKDKEELKSGIEELYAYGNTNISGALFSGIQALQGKSNTKALILMSDGIDNCSTEEEIQEAIDQAKAENILVFTVGFGECDQKYLKNISDQTGGIFMLASDVTELSDLYLMIQRYIVNNYSIRYTIKNNTAEDPRYLTVDMPEYHTQDTKYYSQSDKDVSQYEHQNVDEDDEDSDDYDDYDDYEDDEDKSSEITGAVKSIEIGSNCTIKGDTITLDPNTWMLNVRGNVLINDFIHCSSDLRVMITKGMTYDERECMIQADSGEIMGTGLYVSYPQTELNQALYNGNYNKNRKFVEWLYSGDDFHFYSGYFDASVNDTGINLIPYSDRVNEALKEINIPNLVEITPVKAMITKDKVEMGTSLSELKNFGKTMKTVFGENKTEDTESKEKSEESNTGENIVKRSNVGVFSGFVNGKSDASIAVTITKEDIGLKGEVKCECNDAISYNGIGVDNITAKFDTQEKNGKYYDVRCTVDFTKPMLLSKKSGNATETAFTLGVSSFLVCPNTVNFELCVDPGPKFFYVFELNKFTGKVTGLSRVLAKDMVEQYEAQTLLKSQLENLIENGGTTKKKAEAQGPEVAVEVGCEAEANLFNCIQGCDDFVKKYEKYGKLGNLTGNLKLQFYPDFLFEGKVATDFLKQNVDATIAVKNSVTKGNSVSFEGNVQLKTDEFFGVSVEGDSQLKLEAKNNRSFDFYVDVDGTVKFFWTKCNGETYIDVHIIKKGSKLIDPIASYTVETYKKNNKKEELLKKFWVRGDNGKFVLQEKFKKVNKF